MAIRIGSETKTLSASFSYRITSLRAGGKSPLKNTIVRSSRFRRCHRFPEGMDEFPQLISNRLQCRSRFPALTRTIGGQPVAFFDGPGGSQVPQSVIDAVGRYLGQTNANRGGRYATAHESDELLESAHETMAEFQWEQLKRNQSSSART